MRPGPAGASPMSMVIRHMMVMRHSMVMRHMYRHMRKPGPARYSAGRSRGARHPYAAQGCAPVQVKPYKRSWIAWLPTTEAGFVKMQYHVDLLSGKVHAVPTSATATAVDPTVIICDMCLRSCNGFPTFPDVLVVDHDPKLTSDVFRTLVRSKVSRR